MGSTLENSINNILLQFNSSTRHCYHLTQLNQFCMCLVCVSRCTHTQPISSFTVKHTVSLFSLTLLCLPAGKLKKTVRFLVENRAGLYCRWSLCPARWFLVIMMLGLFRLKPITCPCCYLYYLFQSNSFALSLYSLLPLYTHSLITLLVLLLTARSTAEG